MQGLVRSGGFALLLAAGCASYTVETPRTPPVDARAPVRPDAAEICVLHPARAAPAGGVVTHVVRDNGQLVGATVGQGYFCYGARPGLHRVASEVGIYAETLDLVLTPGERVFLQQSFLTHEGVALARMPEPEARAALALGLPYQQLVTAAEPVPSPSSVAAAPPLSASPPSPPPPRRRPAGLVVGAAAGLGMASSRTAPATRTTGGFGALGSVWTGLSATDLVALALRIDAAFMNGAVVADVALHLALFPGASRSGPVRDLMIFADGGIRVPTSTVTASGTMGAVRLGIGWEPWQLGPARVGPFVCGQVARGGGEADAAVIGGLGASLYPKAQRK